MSLPNLPIPEALGVWGYARPTSYTAEQLQAYGQQCRDKALEEAAIDAERNGHLWSGKPAQAFFELAEQIRSLR